MMRCRHCRAPVLWADIDGDAVVINVNPVKGGEIAMMADGSARRVDPDPSKSRFTAHFPVCPNAVGKKKRK